MPRSRPQVIVGILQYTDKAETFHCLRCRCNMNTITKKKQRKVCRFTYRDFSTIPAVLMARLQRACAFPSKNMHIRTTSTRLNTVNAPIRSNGRFAIDFQISSWFLPASSYTDELEPESTENTRTSAKTSRVARRRVIAPGYLYDCRNQCILFGLKTE